jgi:hypothetical protein
MKAIVVVCLALVASWASALETSMVLRQGGSGQGGLYVVVEPGIGTITIYSVDGNTLVKYGSGNFIEDLNFYDQLILRETEGVPYSALRAGSANCKPTVEELFAKFPNVPTAKETAAGLKSYQSRARQAEDEFWKKDHPYDGVVRGAIGATSLLLCIPCKRALLVYDLQKRDLGPQLACYRNFAAELYVPQVLASSPTPQEILTQLPADVKKEQKEALDEQLKALAESGGALELKPSDPWVAAGSGDRFVVVDPPNNHLMSYEYSGKGWVVQSSRNMQVDLLIPTLYKSTPDEQRELDEFVKTRKKKIDEFGIIPDLPYFKALVGQKQVASGKVSDLQANITADDLTLDFIKTHKMFVYKLQGANNGLELASMRDYTLDVGLQLQDAEFNHQTLAFQAWTQAKNFLAAHQPTSAMLSLKLALSLYPGIYKDIEKDPRAKDLKKDPEWQGAMDAAMKAWEDELKAREDRKKKAQEERDRKKPAK